MLRVGLQVIGRYVIVIAILINICIACAHIMPSQGTLLVTHNLFLRDHDRFELYDLSRERAYGFTPVFVADARFVSLSPANNKIAAAFIVDRAFQLQVFNLSGEALIEPITIQQGLRFGTWSPDERFLAYYRLNATDQVQIVLLDTWNGDYHTLPGVQAINTQVAWAHHSPQITFAAQQATQPLQLWLSDYQGQAQSQLTNSTHDAYCPLWSHDDRHLYYYQAIADGQHPHSYQLSRLDIQTGERAALSGHFWQPSTCPQLSHDGRYLSFVTIDPADFSASAVIFDLEQRQWYPVLSVPETAILRWWR